MEHYFEIKNFSTNSTLSHAFEISLLAVLSLFCAISIIEKDIFLFVVPFEIFLVTGITMAYRTIIIRELLSKWGELARPKKYSKYIIGGFLFLFLMASAAHFPDFINAMARLNLPHYRAISFAIVFLMYCANFALILLSMQVNQAEKSKKETLKKDLKKTERFGRLSVYVVFVEIFLSAVLTSL